MADYVQLFNVKVPKAVWSELIEKHQMDTMSNLIQANVESAGELRRFIECMLDLLERGYTLNKTFRFLSAEIDEY